MNKQQATALIRTTFENAFDEDQYLRFLRELFNGQIDESDDRKFDYYGQYIPDSFKDSVRRYKRLGTYTDPDGNEIDLLIVILKRDGSLDRARTMQRNFAAYHLKRREKETAIIAYTTEERSDWRFSMVRREPVVAFSEKGNLIAKDELTPVRRYSFLVGQSERSHTAQQQLFPILLDDKHDPTLNGLEEAFNIETVTKEFFERYKALFLQLKEELDRLTTKDSRVQAEFDAKELDTANFAKKLLGQIVFLYFLQKKGWLGVREGDTWGTGPKDFLRQLFDRKWVSYDNFFNDVLEPLFYEALAIERDDNIYPRLKARIPFLNGGLFEPMNNYDWQNTAILIDNGVFKDILETFDLYNFTVREDEPLEKEVAVDPEMLGKVFENLLEVTDRKSKGAFYTPREIVHYMCQESLINYLSTAMGDTVPRDDLATFIRVGELAVQNDTAKEAGTVSYTYQMPESIRTHATKLDEALANIKICDPAIGSGAFPVGMMQEIIKAREVLTTYIGEDESRTLYNFKRQAIQESIYGVDIDPGAIDIAKLRLWLSLVVDEDDYHHIKPLPNLDYKIVCGNSLLSVQKDLFNLDLFQQLEKLKTAYFDETNPQEKQKQRAEIDALITQLTGDHSQFDMQIYFSEVFHNGSFDVVIGNPPYVRVDNIPTDQKAFYKSSYTSSSGKYDLYYLFFEKAGTILSSQGMCAFITPNKFCAASSGKNLRGLLFKTYQRIEILSTSHLRVFDDAANYPVISLLKRSWSNNDLLMKQLESVADLTQALKQYTLPRSAIKSLPDEVVPINVNQAELNLVLRCLRHPLRIGRIFSISEGLRIPTKYEVEQKSDYHIVKQYQFERYSQVKTGTFISKKDLAKILRPGTSRYKKIFADKIIIAEDALQISATVDLSESIPQGGIYFGVLTDSDYSLMAILALLNSKLLSFIYEILFGGMHMGGGYLRYRTSFLEGLPLPALSKDLQSNLAAKAQRIISSEGTIASVQPIEDEIDQLVYQAYGLDEDDIALIEGRA